MNDYLDEELFPAHFERQVGEQGILADEGVEGGEFLYVDQAVIVFENRIGFP